MKKLLLVLALGLTATACGSAGGEPVSGDQTEWFHLGDPANDRDFRCIWMTDGAYQGGLWCYEP